MNIQPIQNKIYEIRELKVMLDFDLAVLYGVETKVLNQAVKRNINITPYAFTEQGLARHNFSDNLWKSPGLCLLIEK